MATNYELMLELEHEQILSMGGYSFLSHALKRLFAVDVSTTIMGHGNVDTWNVEIEMLPAGASWDSNDDDSDVASVDVDGVGESRLLGEKSTKQARLFRATVTFEVNDFAHGLSLKASMDTAFMVALQSGVLRAYVHRAFYSQVSEEFVDDATAEEYEQFVGMVKLKHGNFSSRYGGGYVSKSSRPDYDWSAYYNISWSDSDWDDDYIASRTTEESVPWYQWALDPVDIVIIVFVPVCTITLGLLLFGAFKQYHDKVINDWGYEIHAMDLSNTDGFGNNQSSGLASAVVSEKQVEMSGVVHNPLGSY